MERYILLYQILREADSLSKTKGWVYLLFYPLMKEIDTMRRHIQFGMKISSYDIDLVDAFYFNFELYDAKKPTITIDEFKEILKDTDYFVPSPLKGYACGFEDFCEKRLLINYHDASPCFIFGNKLFQLEPQSREECVGRKEQERILKFIHYGILKNNLVRRDFDQTLEKILYDYGNLATRMFKRITSWLYPVISFYKGDVVTDQTLAPGQCCVNHLLKNSGFHLIILQHQKNILLTDLFPILYLDFSLADKYVSWIPKDMLVYNYASYKKFLPGDIIQRGKVFFRKLSVSEVATKIEGGRKCLFILTSRAKKYISGTSLGDEENECLKHIVLFLRELNYDVYIRKDPRDKNSFFEDIAILDDNKSLAEAICHYDFFLCDRPGGATIEVLEKVGFVFIKSGLDEFRPTQTYNDLLSKQCFIYDHLSSERKKLFEMFNLLCA